jgi:hypothetical protein
LGIAFDNPAGVLRVIASAGFISAAEVVKIAPAIAVMTRSLRMFPPLEFEIRVQTFERFHCPYMDRDSSVINVTCSRLLATTRFGNRADRICIQAVLSSFLLAR